MLILIHRSTIEDMQQSIGVLAKKLVEKYETGIRYTDRSIYIDASLTYRPIEIFGRYGSSEKCAGLLPDFWYTDRKDMDERLQYNAVRVGGIKLDDWEDALKIIDILIRDKVKR